MSIAPSIPYIQIPDFTLIPPDFFGGGMPPSALSIKPFGALVATGVFVGTGLAVRHARRIGMNEKALMSFVFWVAVFGFGGGHVFDTIFYFPERIAENPLTLVMIWTGLSSFGGFLGAIIGAFAWQYRYKTSFLPYGDVLCSAFPVGWTFGRMGCSVAHDHPGMLSDAWYAVQYPDGGRFDLGLIEMLLTIPLAIAFLRLRRTPRPWGFFLGWFAVCYAPVRFALDFLRAQDLRIADARYFELTPAQWLCFALFVVGLLILRHVRQKSDDEESSYVPDPPAPFDVPAEPAKK